MLCGGGRVTGAVDLTGRNQLSVQNEAARDAYISLDVHGSLQHSGCELIMCMGLDGEAVCSWSTPCKWEPS